MINSWGWEEYLLLVIVRNRAASYSWLLRHVSQEEFFEKYYEEMQLDGLRDSHKQIIGMEVVPLQEDSFEKIKEMHPDRFVLEN